MFYNLCPGIRRILKFGDSLLMLGMSSIFYRVMYYLSFTAEVVDTKFGMKQLHLCDVPMPIHWHLLFLVSFVILQYSSLPGKQEVSCSACVKLPYSVIQGLDPVVTPVPGVTALLFQKAEFVFTVLLG